MIDIDEHTINLQLPRNNHRLGWLLATATTFVLGFTDLMIGSELSFSIFYLIPITLAVLFSGKRLGLIFSVLCALVWIAADLASHTNFSNPFIPVWNTLVRLAYFIFHTLLLTQLLSTISLIKHTSLHDPLTSAANWRYFEDYSNRMIKSAVRDNIPLTLAYIDADNFKQINDRLGHSVGDEVLMTIVNQIKQQLRPQDMLARLGGDEFVILLYGVDFESSEQVFQRIQAAVNQAMQARDWEVTLSIGAMVFSVLPSSLGPMLKAVDELMYRVKKNGKNNLCIQQQP